MFLRAILSSLLTTTLIACGGGGGGTTPSEPGVPVTSTTQTLDASGGTLALQGLSLTLPASALSKATELGLQQESVTSPVLARFRLRPAGQTLAVPAELQYSASSLPSNARFFWEVNGEQWMLPGTVSGNVLKSTITALGYNASGTVVQAQATTSRVGRVRASALRVLPQADGTSEGGSVVVQPVDCDAHISELKTRLARAATEGDESRAVGIFNDLEATLEVCTSLRVQELEQASCDALAVAQSNAQVLLVSNLRAFRDLIVPLYAAEAFVQRTGATCRNADPAANPALIEAKFDQLLDVMKGQMARAEFDDALTVRDLSVVMHLDVTCQQLDLGAVCDRLRNELYPDLLDALRNSAFEECRVNGTPLSVSQFYALGSRSASADKFFGHSRFSLAAVEADLNYCSNPTLGLRVFDGEAVPSELTDRATTLNPLVALGNYPNTATIDVPRDGSLNIAGTVGVLRCPDGSASGAELVVRVNGTEWRRRAASGNGYPLDSAPLLLDLPRDLPGLGIDPAASTGFTVLVNREGGACSDGEKAVLDGVFTLFEVRVGLSALVSQERISAGSFHTCALTAAGGVKCWGINFLGQLGDGGPTGSLTARTAPVNVVGLASGIVAVSAGGRHTCALGSAGGVRCWGANFQGQLGDGGLTDRAAPVNVVGLTRGIVAVSAGGSHTCALTAGGAVKCWGGNDLGQLGVGGTSGRLSPTDVSDLGSGVVALSAGDLHTCALTGAGGVKCWGHNEAGQLGDGSTTNRSVPVDVIGLGSRVTAISAGTGYTCALTSEGGVKCWGRNFIGQLGDGSRTNRVTPVDVSGLGSGILAVSAGGFQTCALTTVGRVKCWGDNSEGGLGNGDVNRVSRSTPVDVIGLGGAVTALGAGEQHACGITSAGGIECWGRNASGELGDGSTTTRLSAVNVIGFP